MGGWRILWSAWRDRAPAIFRCPPGWPRWTMIGYTVLIVVAMSVALYRGAVAGFLGFALLGAVLSTWIGSGLSFARSKD